jgi:hypothetical protein
VSDKVSCKSLIVIVNIEARLEVGSKANGTCLQCQSNYCDVYKKKLKKVKGKNKVYVSKIHILVHVI